jgi:hypothetical protein
MDSVVRNRDPWSWVLVVFDMIWNMDNYNKLGFFYKNKKDD